MHTILCMPCESPTDLQRILSAYKVISPIVRASIKYVWWGPGNGVRLAGIWTPALSFFCVSDPPWFLGNWFTPSPSSKKLMSEYMPDGPLSKPLDIRFSIPPQKKEEKRRTQLPTFFSFFFSRLSEAKNANSTCRMSLHLSRARSHAPCRSGQSPTPIRAKPSQAAC